MDPTVKLTDVDGRSASALKLRKRGHLASKTQDATLTPANSEEHVTQHTGNHVQKQSPESIATKFSGSPLKCT